MDWVLAPCRSSGDVPIACGEAVRGQRQAARAGRCGGFGEGIYVGRSRLDSGELFITHTQRTVLECPGRETLVESVSANTSVDAS